MDKGFYNHCIIFSTCEMRLLNQMLNLSRIFECFSRRFDKVVLFYFETVKFSQFRRPIPKQLPLELN